MPARLLRLRLLIALYRSRSEPMSDQVPWDEGGLSRLVLDDPPIGQQFFEEGVPRPEICSNLPSWDMRTWTPDAYYRILELETPSSVEVGNSGPQELIYSTTDPRFINQSWDAPFPFEAGSDVSTGILHSDANIGVPLLGEPFSEQQYQDMLNLGTQPPL